MSTYHEGSTTVTTAGRPAALTLSALAVAAVAAWLTSGVLARPAVALHLSSAAGALALGLVIMARTKGTASHRLMGRTWVGLMTLAALSSFWLTGLRDGFSVIHLLSVWTLIAMALAIYFIRKGNVKRHRGFMIGTFLGLAGAALGALAPGRMLYRFFFSA
jgi:uncharacterized membrane protein